MQGSHWCGECDAVAGVAHVIKLACVLSGGMRGIGVLETDQAGCCCVVTAGDPQANDGSARLTEESRDGDWASCMITVGLWVGGCKRQCLCYKPSRNSSLAAPLTRAAPVLTGVVMIGGSYRSSVTLAWGIVKRQCCPAVLGIPGPVGFGRVLWRTAGPDGVTCMVGV